MIADPVRERYQDWYVGDNADMMPHVAKSVRTRVSVQKCLQGAKKNRMVGKNEIISTLNGRINQRAGGIQRE